MELLIPLDGQNAVCSPLSALMPLAKLAIGADGKSERELLEVIGVRKKRKIGKVFRRKIKELENLPGVQLSMASKIFISDKANLNQHFEKETKKIFHSSVEKLNFNNAQETESSINKWIQRESDMQASPLELKISGDESCVLVNVVKFRGKWKNKFKKLKKKNFETPAGAKLVTMMTRTASYLYGHSSTLDAKIIEIPYEKEHASLLVILPHKTFGLKVLQRQLKLAPELLNVAIKNMSYREVGLSLPKFNIWTKENLIPVYKSVGLRHVFSSKSGLTKIIQKQELNIAAAWQVSVIDVFEEGTVAESETAVQMQMVSLFIPNHEFRADHPFLFYIKSAGEQIFAGMYVGPKE